jgi:hypothetical protein
VLLGKDDPESAEVVLAKHALSVGTHATNSSL